jgi:hypothetical protein
MMLTGNSQRFSGDARAKLRYLAINSPLNDQIFKGWRRIEANEKLCHSVKTMRREVLFVNYDPDDMTPWLIPRQQQMPLI